MQTRCMLTVTSKVVEVLMAPILDFHLLQVYNNSTICENAKRNLRHFRSHDAVPLLRLESLGALFIEPDAVAGSVGKCAVIRTSEITTTGSKSGSFKRGYSVAPAPLTACSTLLCQGGGGTTKIVHKLYGVDERSTYVTMSSCSRSDDRSWHSGRVSSLRLNFRIPNHEIYNPIESSIKILIYG